MNTHCSLCTRPVDVNDTDQGYTYCCNEPVCYGGEHRGCEIGRETDPDEGPSNCTYFATVDGRITFCTRVATTTKQVGTITVPRCGTHA